MAFGNSLARYVGVYSIGLGLAQTVATRGFARLIGIGDGANAHMALRGAGLWDVATGVGLLGSSNPTALLWARLAGDLTDLALLRAVMAGKGSHRSRVGMAIAAVAGTAVIDLLGALQASRNAALTSGGQQRATEVRKTISVNRSSEEVYGFWREFENLPRFMRHLESVHVTGDRRSHWKAKAPAGGTVEWDAEIVEDRPNELISWRSVEGADVSNWGTVRFMPLPGGRGTQVSVELFYDAPGGAAGALIAKLFGEEPGQQVQEDLRVFKQVMETGQVTLSEATVGSTRHPQRPGRPPESDR